jgi:hypothetical protein
VVLISLAIFFLGLRTNPCLLQKKIKGVNTSFSLKVNTKNFISEKFQLESNFSTTSYFYIEKEY